MDQRIIDELLDLQGGVVSRRQVLAAGGGDHDIARLLRRRVWARVHDGVYVDHTGEPSWQQRAWAAVLYYWPAGLAGESALRAHGVRAAPDTGEVKPVEVVIGAHRSVAPCAGVRVTRVADFEGVVHHHLSPPRVRVEHAALTVAARARTESAAVAVVGEVCQRRHTTAARLVQALAGRPRLAGRRLLLAILEDVAAGAYSVLERRYLRDVERPHGLPTGSRQRRVSAGRRVWYRDVEYLGLRTLIELDGRLGHERTRDRWADLDRDLAAAVAGSLTVRAGWKQVLEPCRLAAAMARILTARGWTGTPTRCGPRCPVAADAVDPPSPTA